ncbi:MAG TPA: DUF6455 family protein [Ferrovibrio sp.]|uniref:DUF6455 family protein n=1 Tax=Ferrovibrio sp. TaxID=1917215 RepID=UPI002ED2B387
MMGLQNIEQRSRLMQQMLERLDIDLQAAALVALGTQLSGAARTCMRCRNAHICQRWFEDGAHGDAYLEFCPNANRFSAWPRQTEAIRPT